MAVKKSRKFTCFVIFFLLKIVHLKQLKWMQCSRLGLSRGYHYSMESMQKGTVLAKNVM